MQSEETARLEALSAYGIAGTAPEREFDDIVRLAARLCGTPVALVTLLDSDQQWFKAHFGTEETGTPLDQAICRHALGRDDLLIIPDLTLDPRTRDNPLVTGPMQLRFYAGAPLNTEDGHTLGTICVIDTKPRPDGLTREQADDLRALARQVMELFRMRRLAGQRDALVRDLQLWKTAATLNQERLVSMFEQAPSFMAMLRGPDHVFEFMNPAYGRLVGNRQVVGLAVAEALPEVAGQGFFELLDKVYRTGEPFSSKGARISVQQHPDDPLSDRYIDFVYQPVHDSDGAISGIFVEGSDVTERVQQGLRLAALSELGDRLRDLDDVQAIAEAAAACLSDAIGGTRTGFGRVDLGEETVDIPLDWRAPGIPSIAGRHRFRDFGSYIDDLRAGVTVAIADVETDPRTQAGAQALLGIQIRAILNLPILDQGRLGLVVFVHHDVVHRWTEDELLLVRQIGDRVQAAIARVVADRQQRVLNEELSHRLKNSFAMVQAIATQTLRKVNERDAVEVFTNRLGTLARAHDLLLHKSWSAADFRDIADSVLMTFDEPERFELSGPELRIGPRAALSLSLLLHELATNAIKYGALSAPAGRVTLSWVIEDIGGEAFVKMTWSETGGPPAVETKGGGFGSRLIRMGLIGTGGVELHYGSSGFSARMQAPLSQIQQS